MAEDTEILKLHDDFYRDGFSKVIGIIIAIIVALSSLVGLTIYLYLAKPPPVTFGVGEEWRILEPVPLDNPYHSTADMLQWVSDVVPASFNYDFNQYNEQLQLASSNFTADGWKIFLNQLNKYANYNNVQSEKLFIKGAPSSAPFVLNQGLILGRYGWWVQMPITVTYISVQKRPSTVNLTLQVLVVRVPTLNNLAGIGIDNVVVMEGPPS